MISPTIRELIAGRRFQRSLVVDIVPHLPAEDEELDRWIEEAVRENDQPGFFYVMLAAQVAGRSVDARHLAQGTRLIMHHTWVGVIAWRLRGDVATHLLYALQNTTLHHLPRAMALLTVAAWCKSKGDGVVPPALVIEARHFARSPKLSEDCMVLVCGLAALVNDEGLNAVILKQHSVPMTGNFLQKSLAYAKETQEGWEGPFIELIKVEPRPMAVEGFTMRRAVERISRNDPCPCGSGKKYKRCCHEKDQERLRHSTHIPGKTDVELKAEMEPHLTKPRLMKLKGHEMARLDPLKIARELHEPYFCMLIVHSLYERAAEAFEQLGFDAELEGLWRVVIYTATSKGHRESVRRLARWHPDAEKGDDHLHISTALVLLEEEPEKMLAMANQSAADTVDEEHVGEAVGFALALLVTQFRYFGIFVARSLIPIVPRKEAIQLLDAIFEARDALNLPPDDRYSDVLDKRFAEEPVDEGKDAGALREAQRKLEAKAAEVRRIKEELEKLRREVERREKPAKTTVTTTVTNSAGSLLEEERLRELRGKVSELKSILNERHEERVTLRRELQQAHTDLDTLRQKQTEPAPISSNGVDREEALLLPGDVSGNQPVRVLEFPRKFHETLSSLPKPVARGAMTMLGRLAAGETAAYVGVVRLKECPETLRQRIGIDHRLLFKLHTDRVEVVDLINRRDLERRIKTLT